MVKPHVSRQSNATAVPPQPERPGQDATGASAASTDAVLVSSAAALSQVPIAVELPDVVCVQEPTAEQPTHPSVAEANVTGEAFSGHGIDKSLALNAVTDELADRQMAETEPLPAPRLFRSLERQTGRLRKQTWNPFEFKSGKPAASCSKMSMVDFIYYNPPGEPMSQNATAGPRYRNKNLSQRHERDSGGNEVMAELTVPDKGAEPGVPFGANGETTIDSGSPTFRSTESTSCTVVGNTGDATTDCSTFDKQASKEQYWNAEQTAQFYRALGVYGTDFTLMTAAFPKRTRLNLKNKFIREEREHRELVQRILAEPMQFDTESVEREFAEPNEPEHRVLLEGNCPREASPAGRSPIRVAEDESVRRKETSKAVRSDSN